MRILIYAAVGLNLIDGSSVWVESLAEVLATRVDDCRVVVLSRDSLQGKGVVPALLRLPNVDVIPLNDIWKRTHDSPPPTTPNAVAEAIKRLDGIEHFDRVIVRAPDVAHEISKIDDLRGRLWAYVIATPEILDTRMNDSLESLASRAGGLLVQTDTQRGLLENLVPSACNKTSVLPPMVKPVDVDETDALRPQNIVSFVYSGKYSTDWNVESFFEIPNECAKVGITASVTMMGDKVHNEKDNKGFRSRILHKFENTAGVNWLGPMPRTQAIKESARHHLGLCWRTDALNDSLEISTKFLEFASQGVPAVVNRTAAYERMLGEGYPYFAQSLADVVQAAQRVHSNPVEHSEISAQVVRMAKEFSYDSAAVRLKTALRVRQSYVRVPEESRRRVLIAAHDLKFIDTAISWLRETGRYRIAIDRWSAVRKHNLHETQRHLVDADVIFCEWCAGPAIWYSKNKRPDQRLFIRLHRFEAFTEMPREVEIDNVDGVIVVSDYLKDLCVREFDWPPEKLVVMPQYCVAEQFRRQKHPGAETTLGMVGLNGFLKRPDLAVEVLRLVKLSDPSFTLRIRSKMPWDIDWLWRREDERQSYTNFFARLNADTSLRDSVIFDRAGADMAEWFRNVGYILSTSDVEGCHTAVAEGMCSGSWPVVLNWSGAESVYPGHVFDNIEEMAREILRKSGQIATGAAADEIRGEASRRFDISRTMRVLEDWLG